MEFIDPVKSAEALRAGRDLVEAEKDLRGVADVRSVASLSRMDNAGGLSFLGLRNMAHCAAGRYLGAEGVSKMDAALRQVIKARAGVADDVRLDDASLNIGSDRIDAANPSATIALARELEYIYAEVMREEGPIFSARRLFAADRRVPAGAKSYTIRRIEGSGEAKFYRAGMEVPLVGIGRDEETAFVKHAVIGMEMDFFSAQSDAFAGIAEAAEKMREMREAMAEFDEQLAWNGSAAHKINGILNYPWLRKRLISTTFESITTAADFQTALDALNNMVNEILDRNPGMSANLRFICSPRLHRLMAQQEHPDSQKTLKERFLAGQPSISSIEEAPHLQGRGPGGEDGVLIVPKGTKGPQIVSPVGFTMMPVQTTNYGFTRSQAAYQSFGGTRMPDVLRSALIWATVDY